MICIVILKVTRNLTKHVMSIFMLLDTSKTAVSRGRNGMAPGRQKMRLIVRVDGERQYDYCYTAEEEDGPTDRSLALGKMVI